MIDFYDTDVSTRKIDFAANPTEANYLTSIQQGLLQQSKNYADVGNIDDAVKSISSLAAVGVSEAKYTKALGQRTFAQEQVADYRSQIAAVNKEVNAYRGFLGQGVEAGAELKLDKDFKEAVGGILVELPSDPNALVGSGGLETVNIAIRQQSDMLNEVLKQPAEGPGLFNMASLDNIQIDESHVKAFGFDSGDSLKDVYDAYQLAVTDEDKEQYMDLIAHYVADPNNTEMLSRGFSGAGFLKPWKISEKEKNAARIMVGSARTYNKLKRLRKEHFIDFPISTTVGVLSQSGMYGQQGGYGGGMTMNWPTGQP